MKSWYYVLSKDAAKVYCIVDCVCTYSAAKQLQYRLEPVTTFICKFSSSDVPLV